MSTWNGIPLDAVCENCRHSYGHHAGVVECVFIDFSMSRGDCACAGFRNFEHYNPTPDPAEPGNSSLQAGANQ